GLVHGERRGGMVDRQVDLSPQRSLDAGACSTAACEQIDDEMVTVGGTHGVRGCWGKAPPNLRRSVATRHSPAHREELEPARWQELVVSPLRARGDALSTPCAASTRAPRPRRALPRSAA